MNIFITGASSGIGYQTALRLARVNENRIIVLARRGNFLDSLVQESFDEVGERRIFPLVANIVDIDKVELLEFVSTHFSNLDVLLNNASLLINRPFLDIGHSDFLDVYESNVFSIYKMTQALFSLLCKSEHPHIVNISSIGGITGSTKFSGLSVYSSSKAAVSVLTECMAEELNEFNIKVNAIALGAVQTEMLGFAFPNYQAPISSEQISEFISSFCTTGWKFFNGKVVPVSLSNP
jgi:NAD(P)-dependent dehydrogenase (short-subunit alcohol dehydrogenase family)